ncbi:unnamed protein product [Dovyalis caffra]|uniref:Uncharacterized protein n=1 Tax=Dovyalis caffra TaxID=77055 RepID=A0AAV1SNN0_9ROSI|nr:unnamed protein product [Dovyalis caffra]
MLSTSTSGMVNGSWGRRWLVSWTGGSRPMFCGCVVQSEEESRAIVLCDIPTHKLEPKVLIEGRKTLGCKKQNPINHGDIT